MLQCICNAVGSVYNQLYNFIDFMSKVFIYLCSICKCHGMTLTLAGFCNVMMIDCYCHICILIATVIT